MSPTKTKSLIFIVMTLVLMLVATPLFAAWPVAAMMRMTTPLWRMDL